MDLLSAGAMKDKHPPDAMFAIETTGYQSGTDHYEFKCRLEIAFTKGWDEVTNHAVLPSVLVHQLQFCEDEEQAYTAGIESAKALGLE